MQHVINMTQCGYIVTKKRQIKLFYRCRQGVDKVSTSVESVDNLAFV